MQVPFGDRRAFLEWYPYLAEIARRTRPEIAEALIRKGFMATGEAKIIDNAIVAFMRNMAPSTRISWS